MGCKRRRLGKYSTLVTTHKMRFTIACNILYWIVYIFINIFENIDHCWWILYGNVEALWYSFYYWEAKIPIYSKKILSIWCILILHIVSLSLSIYIIYFSFILYPAHSRVGRGNLELRHSAPHFLSNSGGIACWVAELKAALCLDTWAKKWKYKCK